MASNLFSRRSKKATTLVSKQTLEQALVTAEQLAQSLMEADSNDTRLDQLEAAVSFLTSVLKKPLVEMQQEGASSLEDYLNDAIIPDVAEKIKQDVYMISKFDSEFNGRTMTASGSDNWVNDRDENGEPKTPEVVTDLPRLAGEKKSYVPPAPAIPPQKVVRQQPKGEVRPAMDFPLKVKAPVVRPKEVKPAFDPAVDGGRGMGEGAAEGLEMKKIRPGINAPKPGENLKPEGEVGQAVKHSSTNKKAIGVPPPAMPPQAAEHRPAPKVVRPAFDPSGNKPYTVQAPGKVQPAGISQKPAVTDKSKGVVQDAITPPEAGDNYKATGEQKFWGTQPASKGYKWMHDEEPPTENAGDVASGGKHSSQKSAAPVAPVTPAPAPAANPTDADIRELSSDTLAKVMKALSTAEDLMNDKAANKFIGAIADELAVRPIEVEEEAAPAQAQVAPAKAAAIFGGLTLAAAEKTATSQGGSWFVSDKDTGTIYEDGGRTPEINEAHHMQDDNTGIKRPATELPSKFAGEMTSNKATKLVERVGNDLKALYLEAKPITQVLDSRPVREAVEAIYRAYDLMGEAAKVLNKLNIQEEAEAQAVEIKEKNKAKKSAFLGLNLASDDDDDEPKCEDCGKPHDHQHKGYASELCAKCCGLCAKCCGLCASEKAEKANAKTLRERAK